MPKKTTTKTMPANKGSTPKALKKRAAVNTVNTEKEAMMSETFANYMANVFKDGALIGSVCLCVFLLMALITFSNNDPGMTNTGGAHDIENLGGVVGAKFSSILFTLLGVIAYIFPVLLSYRALALFIDRRKHDIWYWPFFVIRVIGLALLMFAGTALANLHFAEYGMNLPEGAGGIIGKSTGELMLNTFSLVGSTLFLIAMFLLGMTLFTGISWFKVMERIGGLTIKSAVVSHKHASKQVGMIKERQQEKREQIEKAEKQRKQQRPVMTELAAPEVNSFTKSPIKIIGLGGKLTQSLNKRDKTNHLDDGDTHKQLSIPLTGVTAESIALKDKSDKKKLKTGAGSGFATDQSLPSIDLLTDSSNDPKTGFTADDLETMSRQLEEKLLDFGIVIEVKEVNPGPIITRFEVMPAAGIKASRITNLAKDLARSLSIVSVRVVEVIPGKSYVGIEIPNAHRQMVRFHDIIGSGAFHKSKSPLTVGLGKSISGQAVTADISKMPHLLVAGTTGSGKSVGINGMILSLLYKSTPADVRMIMIDPKMLELSVYDGIPHLLTPVITDMRDAANGLRWCVAEMEKRYKLMATLGVRNLAGYNEKVKEAEQRGEPIRDPLWQCDGEHFEVPYLKHLPFIVVIVDELADMMMVVGKKVEELIARIAQKARAAGIHLVLATQRPSVDVLTGLIKANVPTRLSFMVQSKIDSRTILGEGGAEQLLGHGDMLYLPPGGGVPERVHGAFVTDEEVHAVVADWKAKGEPDYIIGLTEVDDENAAVMALNGGSDSAEDNDALYDEAVAFVLDARKVSISSVQRRFRIGYNRAARLVETMEQAGVVSEMGNNGSREVLSPTA